MSIMNGFPGGGGGELDGVLDSVLVAPLPLGLTNPTYTMMVGNDLLASWGSGTVGLWVYRDGQWVQAYDSGYSWQYFQTVKGGCLIASSSAAGLLFYDSNTKTIARLFSGGYNWQ